MTSRSGGLMATLSKRLLLSYVVDWIVIILMVVIAVIFNQHKPNMRPFSLGDPNLSYPFVQHEKITNAVLITLSLIVPAVVIFLVCLIFVPGPTVPRRTSGAVYWQRKIWEWNAGWLGLGLALALTFLITDGMKNLFGKPRPDLLSRCNPDLSRVGQDAVGGYGDQLSGGSFLVSAAICRNRSLLNDAFRSFPSGHASTSWAGLTYLALFLCSKFAIAIPFLAPGAWGADRMAAEVASDALHRRDGGAGGLSKNTRPFEADGTRPDHAAADPSTDPLRNQAAAPPLYLLVLVLIPVCLAIYISSTRFSDFRHFGFDILFGSLLGFGIAVFAFRWYHLPIRQGAGWAWGARTRDRAFGVGLGVPGYVGPEGWSSARSGPAVHHRPATDDIELGHHATGSTVIPGPGPVPVHPTGVGNGLGHGHGNVAYTTHASANGLPPSPTTLHTGPAIYERDP
ncbi:MAG: hypothetical protein M1826_004065 [Phylliscum demangeonii]|nr:MAG: hypothetical protein M1826_004065 [Phylliscum demangeonii]